MDSFLLKRRKKRQVVDTHRNHSLETTFQNLGHLSPFSETDGGRKSFMVMQLFRVRHLTGKPIPAPGLEGVAGSLIKVSFHGDPISCVSIEIHDGVIVGDILEIF